MTNIVASVLDAVDVFLAWLSAGLKQTVQSHCDIQTADSPTVLVAHDGSLMSLVRLKGVKALIGSEEFDRIQVSMQQSLQTTMSRRGHALQFFFSYNKDDVKQEITDILRPANDTAKQIGLDLICLCIFDYNSYQSDFDY